MLTKACGQFVEQNDVRTNKNETSEFRIHMKVLLFQFVSTSFLSPLMFSIRILLVSQYHQAYDEKEHLQYRKLRHHMQVQCQGLGQNERAIGMTTTISSIPQKLPSVLDPRSMVGFVSIACRVEPEVWRDLARNVSSTTIDPETTSTP